MGWCMPICITGTFIIIKEIIAFDFDDIGYHWFINDISILLYNVLWYPVIPYDDKAEFTAEFMSHF